MPPPPFWPRFRLLWFGQLISAIGDRLHQVALVWIAVHLAGSGGGAVLAVGAAGRLAFGLVGGAYADRLDRQHVIVVGELLSAAAVAGLVFVDLDAPGALVWLGLVSFVVGSLEAFVQPALQASLPVLAPDRATLQRANAWLDINRRLAMALGPAVTGALLAALPLRHFFTLDALSFVAAALAVRALGRGYAWRPAARAGPTNALWRDIRDGVRVVWRHRTLTLGIAQGALWNLVLTPALSLGAALLVQKELHAGPEWLGYVLAAYGIGNVAANLVVARTMPVVHLHEAHAHTARMLFAGGMVAGLGWTLFACASDPRWLLAITLFTACGGPMADLMLLRMIQNDFPTDQVGRVFSLRTTLSRAAGALGMLLAALWYAALGTRPAIAAGGVVLMGYSAWALRATLARGAAPRAPAGSDSDSDSDDRTGGTNTTDSAGR